MLASVTSLNVGDDPQAWRDAGFTVVDGASALGAVSVRFDGDGPGVCGWTVFHPNQPDGAGSLDGLATTFVGEPVTPDAVHHRNGTTGVDHIVVATPDIDRTTAAFAAIGIEARRTRDTRAGDAPLRQRFFRMGTIIEVIGPPEPADDDRPATFWGLALVTDDLDATAAGLGAACTTPKPAVQPGRRIATLKARDLGISVPIAFMSPPTR